MTVDEYDLMGDVHDLIRQNIRVELERKHLSTPILEHYVRSILAGVRAGASVRECFLFADRSVVKPPGTCRGKTSLTLHLHELVHVMHVGRLVEDHCRNEVDNSSVFAVADRLRRGGSPPELELSGPLRGYRSVYWLSSARSFDTELASGIASGQSAADVARDILGLIHFGASSELVYVRFPRAFFSSVWIPTFIDGGDNAAFCVWNNRDRDAGYTWRLDRDTKGLPEVVTRIGEIDRTVTPHYLGISKVTRVLNQTALKGRATEI